jgi:saccharopine dehydrogenase-like NADP-dependent oxidoreductase
MKIVLFGFGMQGKAAFYDLMKYEKCDELLVADISPPDRGFFSSGRDDKASFKLLDIKDTAGIVELMSGATLAVDALPGFFALKLAKTAIEQGVHLVSSMYYLNPLEKDPTILTKLKAELKVLNEEAIRKGTTVLPEFGLDPGIDLVLGAKALSEFDEVEVFNSYGTGIPVPKHANNPLKYKFSWSVPGLLRAYRRPSRIIKNGVVTEIDGNDIFSKQHRHMLDIDGLNLQLECYPNGNSEYYAELFGLKGSVREMGRYACRYPGHGDFWHILSNSGFLDDSPLKIGNTGVSPIEFVAELLASQSQFQYGKDETDLAMVRVEVSGKSSGRSKKVIYQLIDYKDHETGLTAMQRTVGFTMALGARLILDGQLGSPGLISPIDIPFGLLEKGLKEFGMMIQRF